MPFSSSSQSFLRLQGTHMYSHNTHARREFINTINEYFKRHSRHIFYYTNRVELIARITRSTFDRVCDDVTRSTPYECRRANSEGATDIEDKVASISIWKYAQKKQQCACALLLVLRIFPNQLCPSCLLLLQYLHGGIRTRQIALHRYIRNRM